MTRNWSRCFGPGESGSLLVELMVTTALLALVMSTLAIGTARTTKLQVLGETLHAQTYQIRAAANLIAEEVHHARKVEVAAETGWQSASSGSPTLKLWIGSHQIHYQIDQSAQYEYALLRRFVSINQVYPDELIASGLAATDTAVADVSIQPPGLERAAAGAATTPGWKYIVYTWQTAAGETLGRSPEGTISIAAGDKIVVTVPAFPTGVDSARVFEGTSAGGPYYLQGTIAVSGSSLEITTEPADDPDTDDDVPPTPLEAAGAYPSDFAARGEGVLITLTALGRNNVVTLGHLRDAGGNPVQPISVRTRAYPQGCRIFKDVDGAFRCEQP